MLQLGDGVAAGLVFAAVGLDLCHSDPLATETTPQTHGGVNGEHTALSLYVANDSPHSALPSFRSCSSCCFAASISNARFSLSGVVQLMARLRLEESEGVGGRQ